jgi:Tol biopolymer transport system component
VAFRVAHDGAIVFRASSTGQPSMVGIWLLTPSGEFRQLTINIYDDNPAIAPDGSLVAFDRNDPFDGHADIYTIRPDGSGLTLIVGGTSMNRDPVFSPDGSTIAYDCGLPQPAPPAMGAFGNFCGPTAGGSFAQNGLMLANRDGSAKRLIVRNLTGYGRPSWAPDGARIAIAGNRGSDQTTQIYVVRSDGADLNAPEPVTDPLGPGGFDASFSSDGRSILFGSTWWQGQQGNFFLLMNSDGTGLQRLLLQGNLPGWFLPPATGGTVPPTVDVEHVLVPEVQTMSVRRAKRKLHSAGCIVGHITRRYSGSIAAGHVITERPRAGTRVRRRSPVNLVVSRGRRR